MSIQFGNAKSPVFMRVRRTVPQFTFSLSAHFVNSISSVSTGFFRLFSVLFENRYIFLINSGKTSCFRRKNFPEQSFKHKGPEQPEKCFRQHSRSQFHREQRSGETPHFFLALPFVFLKRSRPNQISSLRINL
jgi:hypothetical protein